MTFATRDWYERDGVRYNMVNGRSGVAEAMETSPRGETIDFEDNIDQLEVATGSTGGKFSVYRKPGNPLDVVMRGRGVGDPRSTLRAFISGEKYLDGSINRAAPAIERLIWKELLLDVRAAKVPYPIVTGYQTVMGEFGIVDFLLESDGPNDVVKSIRLNACARKYKVKRGKAPKGLQEYFIYASRGPHGDQSEFEELEAWDCGRGVLQVEKREANVYPLPGHETGSLMIRTITGHNTGRDGSSVVSVASWGERLDIGRINVDSHWDTGALALRFDEKVCDVGNSQYPNFTILGPGLINPDGYAHGLVVIDLRQSKIRTGVDRNNQLSKGGRKAIGVDSSRELCIVSDEETVVIAGYDPDGKLPLDRSLEVEPDGAGPINTVGGSTVGTRAVGKMVLEGKFGGWQGGMTRQGHVFLPEQYLGRRSK